MIALPGHISINQSTTSNMQPIVKFKEYVSGAKLAQAFEIGNLIFKDTYYQNDLTLQQSTYSSAESSYFNNLCSLDDLGRTKSKITAALLSLATNILGSESEKKSLQAKIDAGWFAKWGIHPGSSTVIIGSNNINLGNISGASVTIGNTVVNQVNQYGDNIAGNKVVTTERPYGQPVPEPSELSTTISIFVEFDKENEMIVDQAYRIMKRYRMCYAQWGFVFPDLADEAKNTSDEILLLIDEVSFTADMNYLDEAKEMLSQYELGITELIKRAAKELKTAENDEKSQILILLKADDKAAVVKWSDMKKAYGLMEQLDIKIPMAFPPKEPISRVSVNVLRNAMITAVKRK